MPTIISATVTESNFTRTWGNISPRLEFEKWHRGRRTPMANCWHGSLSTSRTFIGRNYRNLHQKSLNCLKLRIIWYSVSNSAHTPASFNEEWEQCLAQPNKAQWWKKWKNGPIIPSMGRSRQKDCSTLWIGIGIPRTEHPALWYQCCQIGHKVASELFSP